jgi:hypothetical protein
MIAASDSTTGRRPLQAPPAPDQTLILIKSAKAQAAQYGYEF